MKIAIANYGHTASLKDGSVAIPGVAPDFVKVDPIIAAFRRMVREVEFDVCELASTTYFIARAFGAPFVRESGRVNARRRHTHRLTKEDSNNIRSSHRGKATPESFFSRLVQEFGASRIAWGSNYPASEGTLPGLVAEAREALATLPQSDLEWIFCRTAQALYPALAD